MKIRTDPSMNHALNNKMSNALPRENFDTVLRQLGIKSIEWREHLDHKHSTPTWLIKEYNIMNCNPYNSKPFERTTGYILDDDEDSSIKYKPQPHFTGICLDTKIYLYYSFGLKPKQFDEQEFNRLKFYLTERIQHGPIPEKYFQMLSRLGNRNVCLIEVIGHNRELWPNMKQVEEIIKNGTIIKVL